MQQRRLRSGAITLLFVSAMTFTSCSSGWRGCREWTNLASKDASSADVGDVIPGVIYLALSPIACGTALLLSPITEMTDRRDEPESTLATPAPAQGAASSTPLPEE
jgi:hypothetical protein